MLSQYLPTISENPLKRKSEISAEKLSSPPKKLAKLEVNNNGVEDLNESLNKEFDSYLYWKDPLPDIDSELNKVPCCMVCD